MAKEPLFSKLFRESPFSLLKKHMEVVNQTVVTLSDFFAAALVGDWQAAETHRNHIGTYRCEWGRVQPLHRRRKTPHS